MLRCINEEVQVREKCLLSKVTVGQSRKQTPVEETKGRWASRNNQATTAALYTEHGIDNEKNRAIKCVYCDAAHKLHLCKKVTNHNVRRKILSQKNRCFICLRPGHVARNCRTNMRCLKCKLKTQKHFFSKSINYMLRHLGKLFKIQLLNPKLHKNIKERENNPI